VNHEDIAGLFRALGHPIRLAIVERLGETGEGSPGAFAEAFGAPLATVSHHFRSLAGTGMIGLTRTEARRGALEHYYVLSARGRTALGWLTDGTVVSCGRGLRAG
jgi:DNA-binding transcriptional ArsR family regulator